MGYDIHITRKDLWHDEAGPEISLDEWIAHIDSDPEMRLDGEASVDLPSGQRLVTTDESIAVWTAWPRQDDSQNRAWINRSPSGNIDVKNPDADILRKMHRIATALDARVQGDEDEFYGADGEAVRVAPKNRANPDFSPASSPAPKKTEPNK